MELKTLALTAALSASAALPVSALGVGGAAEGGVGGSVGTDAAGVGADVAADVGVDVGVAVSDESAEAKESAVAKTSAAAKSAVELNAMAKAGVSVVSADGKTIGTLTDARVDQTDGSAQAVVDLDADLDLPVSQLAFEADALSTDANGNLSYGMTLADLQSRVNAQIEGSADADVSN